jgi:hypothetical protein
MNNESNIFELETIIRKIMLDIMSKSPINIKSGIALENKSTSGFINIKLNGSGQTIKCKLPSGSAIYQGQECLIIALSENSVDGYYLVANY